jgi:hypothetical protein
MAGGTLGVTVAEELMEIVMRRYDRASTLLTSPDPQKVWATRRNYFLIATPVGAKNCPLPPP